MIAFRDAKQVAGMLAAVSEPTRMLILFRLARGPHHVGQLAELIGIPMVNMSHHLGVMRLAGLLEDEKEGRRVVYKLRPEICAKNTDGALATLTLGRYQLTMKNGHASSAGKSRRKPARRTRTVH